MAKQAIYPGKTKSGIPGVFTNGTLVFSISEDEYWTFMCNVGAFKKYAKRNDFEVDEEQFNKEIDFHVTLALPKDVIGAVMAHYDFSTEEWERIPDRAKVKIVNKFYSK